ncbi:discoidin domain-containing protein [Nonomuraea longicatena]|uniref:Discoidin domain-containing protein n=1 Tax=Nonomuraea longicatena TaxID=83682 RepID=A0ABN1QG43_9ACTN
MSRHRLALTVAAVAALLTTLFVAAGSAAAVESLLSQGRPATASSVETASYPASAAFDGDTAASRWASAEGSDPQWVSVDLGSVQQLSRIELFWEAAYATAYQLQVSADGIAWTTVHATTTGDGGPDEIAGLTASARYVRMHGTARATPYGYSLYEMRVYGGTPTTPSSEHQAESAVLSQAFVDTKHAGYTGTGFVDYVNTVGGYVEFSVTASTAGPAKLTFRYANGTTADRPLAVAVNGTSVATPAFTPTGAWATWQSVEVPATLVAGTNTVRATATTATGGPNLDRLTVGAGGPTEPPGGFVVAAAGDIAAQCTAASSACVHPKTAAQVRSMNPEFVLTMGDNQYDDALLSDFRAYYDTTWGTFKSKTRPAVGNHETYDPAGVYAGYKAYFGNLATPQGKTYYSFDRGNWHFIALDSNYFNDRAQIDWLTADLNANTKGCIAAYWHHPLFSSGSHGNNPISKPIWQLLYAKKADLVLNGHDHHYERFGPQNPDQQATGDGIVEILGGMGGASPYGIHNVQPNSLKRLTNTFGVLKLTLTDTTFSSQLIGVDGAVKDSSPTYTCH